MKLIEDELIIQALREDISSEDITTNAIVDKDCIGKVDLICKQDGIIAGLEVFKRVFELLDDGTEIETKFKEGDSVKEGDLVAVVHAKARALLTGERTALNFLQRMSGIATHTRELVKELEGTNTKLLDTRKTTPNMRIFEKYAVRVGGGQNHRFNLSDGVLIKDNHIGAAGSIKKAVELARNYAPFVRKIEVEVENLDMVQEALEAKVDIIMLDNMDIETMKKAVEIIGDRAKTECSGNVTKDRLAKIAEIGVDYVSSGALTHSSLTLDFSMKNLEILGDS
ncbi:MAG: carboxylating nicotinate-nucleotide diphosphorylase [Clostridiales bacterium]|jgi:nicotinate-nucleotide pyrophosphorylase (carboxylating)|nr:carboxylating nicotinate-nucleotide diphosphorylase [Clostridiales bacterium]